MFMSQKLWSVYLSGEIHSDWRERIQEGVSDAGLHVDFYSPVTNHDASDNCGVEILGIEGNDFWKDHKGAQMNAIRTRTLIENSDIVVVRFGEKTMECCLRCRFCAALNEPLITLHDEGHTHALKEVDAAAVAVAQTHNRWCAFLITLLKET